MPAQTSDPSSRRALLAAAAGGLGALVAGALGRPAATSAAAGDSLKLGQANSSGTAQTTLTNAGIGAAFTLKTTNTSSNASGIFGWSSSTAANATRGVYGKVDGPNSYGVFGRQSGSAGSGAAVLAEGNANDGLVGTSSNPDRYGVKGYAPGTGVYGEATSSEGQTAGVFGVSAGEYPSSGVLGLGAGLAAGVRGIAESFGLGVEGLSSSGTGVKGKSDNGIGVIGEATSTVGQTAGVFGVSAGVDPSAGVFGSGEGVAAGVRGLSDSGWGVVGLSTTGGGVGGSSDSGPGVDGSSADGSGVTGSSTTGSGVAGTSTNSYGVTGRSMFGFGVHGTSETSYAGYFAGPVYVSGLLTKAGGGFRIDHPLDPASQYLTHSFVESPDMKNVYDGRATLGAGGEATVVLPGYFESLNHDLRYQLTALGAPAPELHVKTEAARGRFRIAGGTAGLEVCWQVTGIRRDAFAEAHRIVVEESKSGAERGLYLHPELYGQPNERGLGYARVPAASQRPTTG